MATHDYNLANQDGASFRSDLNNALAAIVSNNSSSTAPATTFAHQIWVDTTANVIKQRNAANDAWIELWRIDGGFNAKTFNSNVTLNAQSDLRFADSDSSNWVAFQAPATVASNVTWTLPSADGTADQALTTNGSGVLSWADAGGTTDNITEGNTSAEVVDTGSDGHFKVVTEGTEALRVNASQQVGIGTASPSKNVDITGTTSRITVDADNAYTLVNHINSAGTAYAHSVQSAGTYRFQIGTTERARIDSSGRLLVGTSSARSTGSFGGGTQQLEQSTYSALQMFSNGTASANFGSHIGLWRSRGNAVGGTTIVNNGDLFGAITFGGYDGTNAIEGAAIRAEVDGTPGANDMPGRLVFSTTADGASSPTERMRINNAGELFLGTTTQYVGQGNTSGGIFMEPGKLYVSQTVGGNTTCVFNKNGDGTLVDVRRSGTAVGSISVTTTATAYNTSSDYRLKENVANVTDGITRLQQLKPSRFNFIADPDKTVDGFIAHEVQSVVPEAITGEKDAVDDEGNPIYQGIDQSKLVPLLTAALQEAIGEIESLKARVAALESA